MLLGGPLHTHGLEGRVLAMPDLPKGVQGLRQRELQFPKGSVAFGSSVLRNVSPQLSVCPRRGGDHDHGLFGIIDEPANSRHIELGPLRGPGLVEVADRNSDVLVSLLELRTVLQGHLDELIEPEYTRPVSPRAGHPQTEAAQQNQTPPHRCATPPIRVHLSILTQLYSLFASPDAFFNFHANHEICASI